MTKGRTSLILKYLINFGGSGLLAWSFYFSYALWTQAPIGLNRQESIELLTSRLVEKGSQDILLGLFVISALGLLSWLIQTKVIKQKNQKQLITTIGVNTLIASLGLGLGILDAYQGLIIEIDRHF